MGIFDRAWRLVKGGGLHEDDPDARGSWHKSRGVKAVPNENVVPYSSLRSTGDLGQGSRRMIDSPFSFSGGKMPSPSMDDLGDLGQAIAVDPPYSRAGLADFTGPEFLEPDLDPGVLAILQSIMSGPGVYASPPVRDFDRGDISNPGGAGFEGLDLESWTPNRDMEYNEHSIPNPNADALGSEGLKGRAAAAKETQPDDVRETLEENPNRSLPKKDDESDHGGDE